MTENSMDQLTALMHERARYEGWLAQLETRRETTPAHVYERVAGDYRHRLDQVTSQLQGRAGELQETAAALAGRIAELFAEENARRDERAEAELRAAVGEFSEPQARSVIERCEASISALAGEREGIGSELARVQEILAVAAPGPVAAAPVPAIGAPAPTPSAPEAPGTAPDDEIVPIEALAPAEPEPAPAPRRETFDELAFLQSVAPASPAPAPPPPPEPVRVETIAEQAAARIAPAANPMPAHGLTPALSTPPLPEPHGGLPQSTLTPGSMPAFLKDMPTEQIKTLKCQECGTMNYPTEWYCERCGGELAAM
jgi:hypothetical protein